MDACPKELIALIFEFACADDSGETARRLGLVCKYFRVVAEPIELRTIAVAGLKQLQGAVARLYSYMARVSKAPCAGEKVEPDIPVRHLFISELKKEDALSADTKVKNVYPGTCRSFWLTKDGRGAKARYVVGADEFWKLATELVQRVSPVLRTLSLLASDNWFSWRISYIDDRRLHPKVLGTLSGMKFPNLVHLTVNHDAFEEMRWFHEVGSLFKFPDVPVLRKLHVVSWAYLNISHPLVHGDREFAVHPLLTSLGVHSHDLEELILCDNHLDSVENALKAIFDDDYQEVLQSRSLPGKLRSVVLQHGVLPSYGLGFVTMHLYQEKEAFVSAVKDLGVDGLEAHLSPRKFPPVGQREYEVLFAEWQKGCLSSGP